MKTFLIILVSIFILTSFVNIPEAMQSCHWKSCPDYPVISIVTPYPNFYNMYDPCGGQPGFGCYKTGWNLKMFGFDALLSFVAVLIIWGIVKIIYRIRNRNNN